MSVTKTQPTHPATVASSPETRPRTAPGVGRLLFAAAVYFVVGKLGLRFAFLHASTSAIWPASGLAFAILLVWGLRYWPAIFVGAFLVNITTAGSLLNGVLIAAGNTLEAVIGTWLVCSFAGGRHAFESARNIVLFWFLACMAATAVAATIGVTSLCATGAASWGNFRPLWATWWLGDAVGGFLTTVLVLLWSDTRVPWTRGRVLETLVTYSVVAGITLVVFMGFFGNRLFFILPALMWAAFRLGPRETAGALALVSIVTIWGTLRGIGPFIATSHSPNEALLRLQSYLAVNAVTTLIVAAVVEEAKKSAMALRLARDEMEERVIERTALLSTTNDALRVEISERRVAEERFRRLLESAPDAMVIVNAAGMMEIVNSQTEAMFGYTRAELIGRPVEMLVPERTRAVHRFERMRSIGARSMPALDLAGVRRDGSSFPLEITLSPIAMGEQTVLCAAIRDKTDQKALEARLMAAERERGDNLRAFAASVQEAQEAERLRVSRELHDDLGQRLAALKMNMQMFEQELNGKLPPRTARVNMLVGDVDRMIAEVRRLSYNLRPLALDDYGLAVALEMLCKEFEKVYNVSTILLVEGPSGDLHDEQLDIALYRIAQGALSNVAKHAAASKVNIQMTRHDHTVVLSVEDDGRGFDMTALPRRREIHSGLGLIGMRERSEILGGTFTIASEPDHGTRIQVQIPITASSHEDRRQEKTNSDR